MTDLATNDLVYSEVHGRLVRYSRTEADGFVVVMDRNTLKELPDLVHPALLKPVK